MTVDFSAIRNHYEQGVFRAVMESAPQHEGFEGQQDLLLDVACVALNRLPPRYIRHDADFYFYLTPRLRSEIESALDEAVAYAFDFVATRQAERVVQAEQADRPPVAAAATPGPTAGTAQAGQAEAAAPPRPLT